MIKPVPSADLERITASRTRNDAESIREDFLFHLFCGRAKFPEVATRNDLYLALAATVRDRLMRLWMTSAHAYYEKAARTVAYLSAEFLIGPQLEHNLLLLGIEEEVKKALSELGLSLDDLYDHEEEPGLGNGGLGRLAACYMDSLSTLQVPAIGYGIRYEFGIFDQAIVDGNQVERTDPWLRLGYPWEIPRPEIDISVKLGGHTEHTKDATGRDIVLWIPDKIVKGVAHDTPIVGHGGANANFLRLWQSVASEELDLAAFHVGDYYRAVQQKVVSENITKVLYPNDQPEAGKILRLEQQYFFVACSLQDMVRIFLQRGKDLSRFHEKYAIQLNDTHPAIAVPELMRILVDDHRMSWDQAWDVTKKTFGYTNHTLLPEALETWSLPLFKRVLPRHLEILFEINHRFLEEVRARFPGDEGIVQRMSLIDEHGERRIRMANLACVGSHAINGVARLHTDLLKQTVLADFHRLWPDRFSNKTNGVTPRRFLRLANPGLSHLITDAIGDGWVKNLDELRGLEKYADDPAFVESFQAVKRANKLRLGDQLHRQIDSHIDPDSIFDVQVKRIHEYKRQHMNILHVISLYQGIKEHRITLETPRTVLFAGKAAPGYFLAKLIIKLIHDVGETIARDPQVARHLRVVFAPDFNVKNAQRIYPAADLSEQISTAGKEASGTGNMKFAMNGALTIGTLDGANVEIREEVGAPNFFLFGLTADEVEAVRARGYNPRSVYEQDPELRAAIDLVASGHFSRGDRGLYDPLIRSLLDYDPFLVLADFRSYVDTQRRVAETYEDSATWAKMAILNVARIGKFSSDRSIREYCDEIWRVKPITLQSGPQR